MKRTAYYLAASLCLISLSLSAAGQDPALRVKVRRPSERSVFRVGERNYGATDRYNPGDESERYSYRAAECLAADLEPEALFADRALLAACHLAQPVLFRASEAAGIWPPRRTIEDFEGALRAKDEEEKTWE